MDYKDIHDRIIDRAKNSNRSKGDGNYYEAHHIVPKCMDGKGKASEWRTHPNIVLLTAKEHFVIHKLLCEIYPDKWELTYAYWLFVNGNQSMNHNGNKYYNIGSREYERVRIEQAEISIKINTGRTHSEETKKKLRKPKSEETKQRMRGKILSEETKQKIREKATGRTHDEKSKKNMRENHADFSGEKNGRARKVICDVTGKIYGCIIDAVKDSGVSESTLRKFLTGYRTNKTSMRYL
jgi:hypothetical protein